MILRKRGKFGHNNVHILGQGQIEEIQVSIINVQGTNSHPLDNQSIRTNHSEERTSHTTQNSSLQKEEERLKQNKKLAEIHSAVRSLETNF